MEQDKRLTHRSKKRYETVYQRNNPRLVFEFKVLFFSVSFKTTVSASSRENILGSCIDYFLFFVDCLDNSVGSSLEKFKFRVEFLPKSSKMSSETYLLRESCGVLFFFSENTFDFSTTFTPFLWDRGGKQKHL